MDTKNTKCMGRSACLFGGHMAGNLTWPPTDANFVAIWKDTKPDPKFYIITHTISTY